MGYRDSKPVVFNRVCLLDYPRVTHIQIGKKMKISFLIYIITLTLFDKLEDCFLNSPFIITKINPLLVLVGKLHSLHYLTQH